MQAAHGERESKQISPLEQLLSLYRAAGAVPATCLNWNLSRFALSYCGLVLTVPGLFEGGVEASFEHFIQLILERKVQLFATFWSDWLTVVAEDSEMTENIVNSLAMTALAECKREGLLNPRSLAIVNSVLGPLCNVPTAAAVLIKSLNSNASLKTPSAANETFLGSFFCLSAIDATPENFGPLRSLLPPGYTPPIPMQTLMAAYDTIRPAFHMLTQSLHESILLPLIRSNPHCGNLELLLAF